MSNVTATIEIVKNATDYTVTANGTQVGIIRPRNLRTRVIGYTWVPASGSPITIREGDDRGGFKIHTLRSALISIKTIATRAAEAAAAKAAPAAPVAEAPAAEVAPVATVATVTYVRTRNSQGLRLNVGGKSVWLGANRFTSAANAEADARAVLANHAASLGLRVAATVTRWSNYGTSVWSIVAELRPAAEVTAEVAPAAPEAFDPAAPTATKFAAESLCRFAVSRGCLLTLAHNREGIIVEPTADVGAVLAALAEIRDVCTLTIKRRNPQSAMLSGLDNAGSAWLLSDDGVCNDETVLDHTDAPLIEEWAEVFDRRTYN